MQNKFYPAAYFLPFLAFSLWCSSCAPSRFYTPNTMQVPVLTGAHEGTISGGISKGGDHTGLETQAIYSPLPHLGLMANYFNVTSKTQVLTEFSSSFFESTCTSKASFVEAGVGGYYAVGPSKEYLLSFFAGFGSGKMKNSYSAPPDPVNTDPYVSDWRYQRWFAQPSLSLKYRRFQVGTGLRLVWVSFLDGNINSRMGLFETERIQLLERSSPMFLTEMAWSLGWRLNPFVISLNSTSVVRGNNTLRDLDLATNYVSVSLGVNLHELKKRKK